MVFGLPESTGNVTKNAIKVNDKNRNQNTESKNITTITFFMHSYYLKNLNGRIKIYVLACFIYVYFKLK